MKLESFDDVSRIRISCNCSLLLNRGNFNIHIVLLIFRIIDFEYIARLKNEKKIEETHFLSLGFDRACTFYDWARGGGGLNTLKRAVFFVEQL